MGYTVQKMPKVTLQTDDVIDAFCRMLEPGIAKGVLRLPVNRYGVDIIYNKTDPALIMFHFVTREMFEINMVMDLKELERRGKEYLDHLMGLLCDQVEQARKVKQESEGVTIHTGSFKAKQAEEKTDSLPKLKDTVAAFNEVIH